MVSVNWVTNTCIVELTDIIDSIVNNKHRSTQQTITTMSTSG